MERGITKDYIRGLFDGEGTIYFTSNKNAVLEISNEEFRILRDSKELLDNLLIKSRIKKNGRFFKLRITSVWNIYQFWKIIGTYHPKKRSRFVYYFTHNEKLRRYLLVPRIREWAEEGLSQFEISKKTGISKSSISQIINRKLYKER